MCYNNLALLICLFVAKSIVGPLVHGRQTHELVRKLVTDRFHEKTGVPDSWLEQSCVAHLGSLGCYTSHAIGLALAVGFAAGKFRITGEIRQVAAKNLRLLERFFFSTFFYQVSINSRYLDIH